MRPRRRAQVLLVLVTHPAGRAAGRFAARLVDARLAACVNILPAAESVFWWRGKLDRGRESLLLIKTTASAYAPLEAAITRWHPYDVPEVIAVPIMRGSAPYLAWVKSSVQASRAP